MAQRGGAVGGVEDRGRAGGENGLHGFLERVQLELEEAGVVLVGGGEMGHDPGQFDFRDRLQHIQELDQVARIQAQAPHTGVDLDVAAQAGAARMRRIHKISEERKAPDDDLGAGVYGLTDLGAGQGAEHDYGAGESGLAQACRFPGCGHAQDGSAGIEAGLRHLAGAMSVAVGLDHGHEAASLPKPFTESPHIVPHAFEVDRSQRPVHG